MMEQPNAQLPWPSIQHLLDPYERLTTVEGYLFAPRQTTTLIALFYALEELNIKYCLEHQKNQKSSKILISSRAFSTLQWLDESHLAIGSGCLWQDFEQVLFEQKMRIHDYQEMIIPSKMAIGELIAKQWITCLGVELISCQGEQLHWGSRYETGGLYPSFHQLLPTLPNYPGLLTTIFLKLKPQESQQLQLLWEFPLASEGWKHWNQLHEVTTTWDQCVYVISGCLEEKHYLFAQLSGSLEEIERFKTLCPLFSKQVSIARFSQIKTYLKKQIQFILLQPQGYELKEGDYLWHHQRQTWLLTSDRPLQTIKWMTWQQRVLTCLDSLKSMPNK